jgi:gamma-glutamyl phosphate reductase
MPATTAPSEKLSLDDKLVAARTASIALAQASTSQKNAGLEAIAQAVGTAVLLASTSNVAAALTGQPTGTWFEPTPR